MRTHRFEPAIGQRYVHVQSGAENRIWVVTAIAAPRNVDENSQIIFTEEITERVMKHSVPCLAQWMLDGTLLSQQRIASQCDFPPVALADLVYTMSDGQRRRFTKRVSYVQALERAGAGLSPKSMDFAHVIKANHVNRQQAWKLRQKKQVTQPDESVEPAAPAPASVYRWYLSYRKSGNDFRILAQEALATRTRSSRKPKERALLEAFLYNRKASVGERSISSLTDDFNRLLKRTDPLHVDDLIENLYREAQEKAAQNRAAKNGKRSMRKKAKKRPVTNAQAMASEPVSSAMAYDD